MVATQPDIAKEPAFGIVPTMTEEDDGMSRDKNSPMPRRPGGTTLTERYRRAKAALAKADPFYTSEDFWKGFENHPVDETQVAKLEEMVRSYQQQGTQQSKSWVSSETDPIDVLLEKYDTGEIETVEDLADKAEVLATETGNELLRNAVKSFRKWQKEDWELAGRGDSDEAEAALIAEMKRARSASSPDLE